MNPKIIAVFLSLILVFPGYAGFLNDDIVATSVVSAGKICQEHLGEKVTNLSHSSVDRHSSRYDQPRKHYVMLLYATAIDGIHQEEFRVMCHVNEGENKPFYMKPIVVVDE